MKLTNILNDSRFDKNGLYEITLANGKVVKEDKNIIKKLLNRGEFIYTKFNRETITLGKDDEEENQYIVSGRDPKSFRTFTGFDKAFDYWTKTYRKPWDK